ncbi:acyl carrier protein [Streptomyces luteogriseus]|jgi:acyl carrier protein|uniref:Acyl carrier protein n=5 Tax=Streptomyces TaxID=1883 RepID=A0A7W7DJU4_9ACTN|nr:MULTISPECIES: acyl carrier protein [Streptomyces]KFG73228.1 acyl carrier protein [Streptomyces mutabilis]MBB4712001.1 acyl carrier protein [Streptomyces luteogriseus]MBQ1100500.1 acyl carrier protein [Streptomyces sp. b94]MCF1648648.1 acyl carrier protein [Streptomyces indiaensis]MCX3292265.1 acyl carrier protein [Streptomyces sp. NEAU-H22]
MLEQLKEILSNKLKVSPEAITPEATREDIELDSLAVVELSLLLKSELGLDVSDDDLLEAETVADMVRLMEERSAKV